MRPEQETSDNPSLYSNHEIRNLFQALSGLITNLQLGMKQLEKIEKAGENKMVDSEEFSRVMKTATQGLKTMSFCAKQGKYLLDNKLLFSKLESGNVEIHPEPFDPQKVIQQVIDIYSSMGIQQKQIKIISNQIHRAGSSPYVKGDPSLLIQILSNLLNNALKFTGEGGTIEITLQEELKEESDHSILCFSVKDSGIGMTEQELQKLFKKFSQANSETSGKYGGTGLGLRITKLLVELMGGNIQVASQKGKGTVFTFSIACKPCAIKERSVDLDQKYELTETPSVRLDGIKILVVDDEVINRRLLDHQMKAVGGTCYMASDGKQAINYIHQNKDKVDIILMDVQMKEMDGLTATKKIRELTDIPVIGISGNTGANAEDEAKQAGMNYYLTKPTNTAELLNIISGLVKIDSQKLHPMVLPPSPFELCEEEKPKRSSPRKSFSSPDPRGLEAPDTPRVNRISSAPPGEVDHFRLWANNYPFEKSLPKVSGKSLHSCKA